MKPVLICVILLASVVSTGISADKPVSCKKFKVTYHITYNELTLGDAALREAEVRKRYSDACRVDVKVAECDSFTFDVSGSYITITDSDLQSAASLR